MPDKILTYMLEECGIKKIISSSLLALAGAGVIFVVSLNVLPDDNKIIEEKEND